MKVEGIHVSDTITIIDEMEMNKLDLLCSKVLKLNLR